MGGRPGAARGLVGVVALAARIAAGQVIPLGDEFQVNAFTTGAQRAPAVGLDAAGNVVAVWQSSVQDGFGEGIFGRIAVGARPIAPEFQINVQTFYDQRSPVVGVAPNGSFVVLWSSAYQDGFGQGIVGRRYVAGGAFGTEFAVNVFTFGDQTNPGIAMGAGGDFVAVWDSDTQDGEGRGVFARRYDADGDPIGGEFQVNTTTLGDQATPAVAVDGTGAFVVAWSSFGQDGQYGGVFARRFSALGAPLGGEVQVNTYTTDNQFEPSIAADAAGRFVVVWTSVGADGDYDGVAARRFDATGAALGGEFTVNAEFTGAQYHPSVAADATGDFVVVWQTPRDDLASVVGRRFDASGVPLGGDFQVTTYTTSAQFEARVARHPAGDFVVTWAAYADDSRTTDVLVRRFTVPTTTLPPCAVSGTPCDDGDPCTANDSCSSGQCTGESFCNASLPDDGAELPGNEPVQIQIEAAKGSECEAQLFGALQAVVAQEGDGSGEPPLSKAKVKRVGKRGRVVLKLKLNKAGRERFKSAPAGRLGVVLRLSVRSSGRVASLARILTLLRR